MLEYQSINTASGQTGFCKLGSGPALILAVGYSGTLFHWNRDFIYELARHFTVYLPDNRKIGLSDSTNPASMLGLAQDLVDFIEALQLNKPYLFGWSMGGVITQTVLRHFPEILGGVVLLATIPHATYTNREFLQLVANAGNMPGNHFREQLYGMFFSENPRAELKQFITNSALPIADYSYRFTDEARALQDYAVITWEGMDGQLLSRINVPALILWARDDLVVGAEASQLLANFIPDAKLIVYPRGGHFFLHKNPVATARDIINYFL